MLENVDELLREVGSWGYLGLGLASLIEYVFPPFPGDTVTLLGGAWAARGDFSLIVVFLSLLAGSLVGMTVMWRLGRSIEGKLSGYPDDHRLLGLEVGQLHRAQALMKTKGAWLLLVNRFLPSFRAVVFIAAGASGYSWRQTMAPGLLSAAVFNAVLMAAGGAIGDNAEAIAAFFRTWRTVSFVVLGVIAAAVLARFLWRRARAQSRP